jgi:putative ABC transport system permease protein
VLLICIDPLMLRRPFAALMAALGASAEMTHTIQFYGHFVTGLPATMVGFLLVAPLLVSGAERLAAPLIGAGLRLPLALLRQQLSSGLWRAAGTAAALMVGLATLLVLQIQGRTMLGGWKLPDKFPDIFIVSLRYGGLTPQERAELNDLPEIRPVTRPDGSIVRDDRGRPRRQVMPIAIAAPGLSNVFLASFLPESTMFFGVDPDMAFDMMDLEFIEGNRDAAVRELKLGRHLIITDELRRLRNLHVGDKLPLETLKSGTVDYTIAGVVWSPGIDVIVSMFDMGLQFDQRTAWSVFGTLDDARRDFGVQGAYLFAANLSGPVDKADFVKSVVRKLGDMNLRAGDVRQIKATILDEFTSLLNLASTVAFAAMAVASLGVTNTVMAAVRTRRWQFGILRSAGLTQWQLLRLVMAEAITIGGVGAVLGIACGLLLSTNARVLGEMVTGYAPAGVFPWGVAGIGVASVLVVAILASLWPAVTVARTEPLTLLQSGRSSA